MKHKIKEHKDSKKKKHKSQEGVEHFHTGTVEITQKMQN